MGIKLRYIAAFFLLGTSGCAQFQGIFDAQSSGTAPVRSSPQPGRVAMPRQKKIDLDKVARNPVEISSIQNRAPIVTKQGSYYFVKGSDTLATISDRYNISWEDLAQINGLYDSDLVVGRRLFIPHKRNLSQYVVVSKVINSDRTRAQKSKKVAFVWPIEGPRITSVFGHRWGRPHDGVDIGAKVGTPVLAAEEGLVIFSERFAGYGNLIVLKHAQDYFTAYAHNSQVFVKKGQRVKKGQNISLVGMTGRTTGPHLHFEMRVKTQAVDPLTVLPQSDKVKKK